MSQQAAWDPSLHCLPCFSTTWHASSFPMAHCACFCVVYVLIGCPPCVPHVPPSNGALWQGSSRAWYLGRRSPLYTLPPIGASPLHPPPCLSPLHPPLYSSPLFRSLCYLFPFVFFLTPLKHSPPPYPPVLPPSPQPPAPSPASRLPMCDVGLQVRLDPFRECRVDGTL